MKATKNNLKEPKILIYSGAFNPPHLGHLQIVLNAIKSIKFDEIIINVDKQAPWKNQGDLVPYTYRKKMLFNLFSKKVKFNFFENKSNLMYAIDIVREIISLYSIFKPYYLIGEDQYNLIQKWKDYDEFNKLVTIICHRRSDKQQITKIDDKHIILYTKHINCDSTALRSNLSTKYLGVPNYNFILNNHLYLQYHIADMMSRNRYEHSLRVLDTITQIAYANHFTDSEVLQAQIAAALHDITKLWDDEQYMKMFSLQFLKTFPSYHCAHGHAAAEVAQKKFKITDNVILNAIRNHVIYNDKTNNKISMALYCADKLEPMRLPIDIPDRQKLLDLCCENLHKGFNLVLKVNKEKYKC